MVGCLELDRTILKSGHDPDHMKHLQPCGAELDCWGETATQTGLTRWSLLCPVSLEPAPQQWGTTDHSGWGGQCYGAGMLPWGEPKRKKSVRGGGLPGWRISLGSLPPSLRRNLALVVRYDGRICFHGNQKKPSPKWSSNLPLWEAGWISWEGAMIWHLSLQ